MKWQSSLGRAATPIRCAGCNNDLRLLYHRRECNASGWFLCKGGSACRRGVGDRQQQFVVIVNRLFFLPCDSEQAMVNLLQPLYQLAPVCWPNIVTGIPASAALLSSI